ncbi:MAG: undecaprenyl-phosphate glucose phosphotransferase [Ectothiorhodospiraceae bacterium]|nr:undecaprenyl-phosphate glucose phosphotransferase [Ectothiorhodospiraceae bacterium]
MAVAYLVIVERVSGHWHERDTLCVLLAAGVFHVAATANDLYHSWRIAGIWREIGSVATAWMGTACTLLLVSYLVGVTDTYVQKGTVPWLVATPVVLALWRVSVRVLFRALRRQGRNSRTAAIVGATEVGLELARHIDVAPWTGLRLLGFHDDRTPADGRASPLGEFPLLGGLDALVETCRRGDIDVVFIALPFQAELRIRRFIRELGDTTASVYLVQDFSTFELSHGRWFLLGGIPMVSIHETPFYGVDGWIKRVEDLVLASIICVIIAVPCLLIALAIKATSPGPLLFKQRRYGLNGREITVWKFRTMRVAEDGARVPQARRDDPRVTPLGRILRRTSLDELPQFVNVLAGTMSIVGPRPHAIAHNEEYRKLVDRYMLRHKVKPGITGWAQINGWRGECETVRDMERRVEFDLAYIRNWSVTLDLKIIALTLARLLRDDKAY